MHKCLIVKIKKICISLSSITYFILFKFAKRLLYYDIILLRRIVVLSSYYKYVCIILKTRILDLVVRWDDGWRWWLFITQI